MIKRTITNLILIISTSLVIASCEGIDSAIPTGTRIEIKNEIELQKEMEFQHMMKYTKKINDIGYPILMANADLCPKKAYDTGFGLWSTHYIARRDKKIAKKLYNLDKYVQISIVKKGSVAEKNDIRAGDRLISINGDEIRHNKSSFKQINKIFKRGKNNKLTLVIAREDQKIAKSLDLDLICDYDVIFNQKDTSVNASANGKRILIAKGMMRFTENDEELALVFSHELAHNTMHHSEKTMDNVIAAKLGGDILDIALMVVGINTNIWFGGTAMAIGSQVNSVEFEQEADYAGMYYMARTGYDTKNVAHFWRRMSIEDSATSLDKRSSHPSNSERVIAINKAHEEIEAKKLTGEKLIPELKEKEPIVRLMSK